MGANVRQIYPVSGAAAYAEVEDANTALDGTGALVTVLTASSNGTKIDRLAAIATQTTSIGMIRWFLSDGVSNWLWMEMAVAVKTPGAGVPAWDGFRDPTDGDNVMVILPSGWSIKASTHIGEPFMALIWAKDY